MNTTTVIIKEFIGGPSDFGVGWIIILISSIVTIFIALANFSKSLTKKIQKKSNLLKTLSLLTVGVNIGYFKTLLGNPVFVNSIANYDEFIFVHQYFYVQALVDQERKIALFSVTTRSREFNPVLNIGDGGILIKLGKTALSDLGKPKKVLQRGGDHGSPLNFYSEIHYFGMEGHYLDYAFSINESGSPSFSYEHVPKSFFEMIPEDLNEIKRFRSESIINTYTVIGSMRVGGDDIEFGPRHSQIRILHE